MIVKLVFLLIYQKRQKAFRVSKMIIQSNYSVFVLPSSVSNSIWHPILQVQLS